MEQFLNQLPELTRTQMYIIALILSSTVLALSITRRKLREKKGSEKSEKALFAPQQGFAKSLKTLFLGSDKRLEDLVPQIEELLLTADVGLKGTESLIESLLSNKEVKNQDQAFGHLKKILKDTLTPSSEFQIDTSKKPYVIYLVGVNGVGKTTTIGKLACQFKSQGLKTMLVAADTFRAAAVDQLRIWSERNEVDFVGGSASQDPSSVIVDGLKSAKAKGTDVVLVDTAGRLQSKTNLMNELSKMVRMSEKVLERVPDQIFLVVDAITGQNGFSQAKVFLEAVDLTGVILTKYDATSKGGIIISIVQETGLPIRYVGLGEGIEDLKKFEADEFVEKLFAA